MTDPSPNWMDATKRVAHVLYVSPDWVKDRGSAFDAGEFAAGLKEAGAQCIEFYMKDFWGTSYYNTRIGHFCGRDVAGELIEACHRAGIRFIGYYCIYWDKYAWDHHPEWRAPGWMTIEVRDGGIVWPVSMDSGYRDYVHGQLEEIVRNYEVDGMWLDMPDGNLDEMKELIQRIRPGTLITWNNDQLGIDAWRGEKTEDFISFEAHGPDLLSQSRAARLIRKENKPFEITSPGSTEFWGGWSLKPPSLLQVEAATVMANGGTLTVGLNPMPSGKVLKAELENLSQLWRFVETWEQYTIGATPVSDVAVLSGGPSEGLNAALEEHHIQFDFIKPDSRLDGYRLVILPDGADVPVERVREYAQTGGALLAMHAASDGLEDLFGITSEGDIPFSGCYAALRSPDLATQIPDYPILLRHGRARCVSVSNGASLASIVFPVSELSPITFTGFDAYNPPGEESVHPMIVEHLGAEHHSIYFAATLAAELARSHRTGTPWLKRLLANMVMRLLPEPLVTTTAPPGVAIVVARQPGRLVIHAINKYAALPGTYQLDPEEFRISGVQVDIRLDNAACECRAYDAISQQQVARESDGHRLRLTLPPFSINAVVVVE